LLKSESQGKPGNSAANDYDSRHRLNAARTANPKCTSWQAIYGRAATVTLKDVQWRSLERRRGGGAPPKQTFLSACLNYEP
jgi:hypothetical protein